MKSPVKSIILYSTILLLFLISTELFAGSQPPDPGGDPTGGGPPVGGGAPVGNGTIILISMGLIYFSYKILKIKRSLNDQKD